MNSRGASNMPALARKKLSRPIRDAIRDCLIRPGVSILDYGCGRGDDVRILCELGYNARGWDPVFAPVPPPASASVVNFGYVLNVIADVSERNVALCRAYELAEEVLIVSAYVHNGEATKLQSPEPHLDGLISSRGTFQKLFRHRELGDYLRSVLSVQPERADFGVYYLRKAPNLASNAGPGDSSFGDGRVSLLVEFAASYWRPIGKLLKREFTDRQLGIFEAEFSTYKALCEEATTLLERLDSVEEVRAAYRQVHFGKRTREALYVHRCSVKKLPALLLLVVATARVVALNEGDGPWEVVKISPDGRTVSFLDTEPFHSIDHPALKASTVVARDTRTTKTRRESSDNPSIYHRKELFLHPSHQWFEAFERLTLKEESLGLLNRSDIGRLKQWELHRAAACQSTKY